MRSNAATVEACLNELPPERREMIEIVRQVILDHLPEGYVEVMRRGMISYEVPLVSYPDTYNGQPLSYAALASQKNYVSLYLMAFYGDEALRERFETTYCATGKRLDVGKSCVRFRKLDDLPLDLVPEMIGAVDVDDYVARAKAARR